MSTDMVMERSSTRLHAPPGGKSSICFGSYEPEPVMKKAVLPAASVQVAPSENIEPAKNCRTSAAGAAMQSGSSMKDAMGGGPDSAPVVRRRQAPGGNSTFTLG